ncbi:MAG: DUF996 domain-containing protein [Candidatus Bathyarchaeota archaeon]|nr:DUF996 domain-containing protein [Candidatus Termiticorpusculum sp.]
MTVETSKILAGVGSILFGSLIGIILVLVGMKGLSEYYNDRRIYDGLVTATIFFIIGLILSVVGAIFLFVLIGIPLIIVGFIFELLAARYFRNALYALSERSGEHLFHTAGILIWIGAILSIIVVGIILIWIGFIIAAIGFFTLKVAPSGATGASAPPPSYGYTPPPNAQQTTNFKSNFCPNCGTPVASEATFCAHCGKQI